MARLVDRLNDKPGLVVELVTGEDDVCRPCPHLDNGACRRFGSQVEELDARVLERLGYRPGDCITWGELLDNLSTSINAEQLAEFCGDCRWTDLSYCTDGMKTLEKNRTGGGDRP